MSGELLEVRRFHGRGNDGHGGHGGHGGAGYRYIHTALDDRTRVAYSEILDDEQAATAAAFWGRAARWFAERGVTCERVITDNGPATAPGCGTSPALGPARS